MEIKLMKNILGANDEIAAANRKLFAERGVVVMNLMGSPGSGKTTLLEQTLSKLVGKIRERQQIDFVEQYDFRLLKNQWIFERLIVAFGYRQHDRFEIFADVEFSRANQISDVLNNQQVRRVKI